MDRIKLGWGRRETSIDEPVSVPGQMHMRISEGIHDPLYVTALAIDCGEGEDHVVFLSCDVGSFPWDLVPEVKTLVGQMQPQIRSEWIIMNATHTHTAACTTETPERSPDGAYVYPGLEYRKFFVRMCAEAVVEAWDTRKEGGFAYGYGYAVVGHTRRVCYFHDQSLKSNSIAPNGNCIMYGNTNDPDFSHYEGCADHFLNALYTFDADEKLTGMIINVPCPSQNSEQMCKLSADYWGDVRELAAKEFGSDVYIMPQCAPAGDLAPRILHYLNAQARRMSLKFDMPYEAEKARNRIQPDDDTKRFAERKDIAERIVASAKEVYGWASKEILTHVPLRHRTWTQYISRRFITDEELQTCQQKLVELEGQIPEEGADPGRYRVAVSRYNSVKNRNKAILYRYERQKWDPVLPMEAHVVALGDIAFATNKFELYQDFMHRVQARSPFIQTFVMQLTGDGAGSYLATKRSQENKGYGASMYCNWAGYEGGQQWVEGVLYHLNQLKDEMEKKK